MIGGPVLSTCCTSLEVYPFNHQQARSCYCKSAILSLKHWQATPERELSLSPGTELTLNGVSYVVDKRIGKGGFGSIYRVHGKDQVASDIEPAHEFGRGHGAGQR